MYDIDMIVKDYGVVGLSIMWGRWWLVMKIELFGSDILAMCVKKYG